MIISQQIMLLFLIYVIAELEHAAGVDQVARNVNETGFGNKYQLMDKDHTRRGPLPEYLSIYGKMGKNYDLDEFNKPFIWCEKYDASECSPGKSIDECTKRGRCYPEVKSHHLRCMAVLVYNTSTAEFFGAFNQSPHNGTLAPTASFNPSSASSILKGCWSQYESELIECASDDTCVVDARGTGDKDRTAMFCCCKTHDCNRNLSYKIVLPTTTAKSREEDALENGMGTLLVICISLLLFVCVCAIGYFLAKIFGGEVNCFKWRHFGGKKQACGGGLEPMLKKNCDEESMLADKDSKIDAEQSEVDFHDIVVFENITEGHFGEVYRAMVGENLPVALKVYKSSEMRNWINERDIYTALNALQKHENIASFVAAFPQDNKFWLLTAYYKHGSLYDYLKRNVLSFKEMGKIMCSTLSGLAYMHMDYCPAYSSETDFDKTPNKGVIVHRDLKSKNILIKDDFTACIADFGIAMKCDVNKMNSDETHEQIGTRRYMSPEVLEGAMEFSSFAFQQVDVYAAALVMWELLSRTQLSEYPEEQIVEYALPYEAELGTHPSLNELRNLVAGRNYRPLFRETLYKNLYSKAILKTINEMWFKEPEGRITSSCARDRMARVYEKVLRKYYGIKKLPRNEIDVTGNGNGDSAIDCSQSNRSDEEDNYSSDLSMAISTDCENQISEDEEDFEPLQNQPDCRTDEYTPIDESRYTPTTVTSHDGDRLQGTETARCNGNESATNSASMQNVTAYSSPQISHNRGHDIYFNHYANNKKRKPRQRSNQTERRRNGERHPGSISVPMMYGRQQDKRQPPMPQMASNGRHKHHHYQPIVNNDCYTDERRTSSTIESEMDGVPNGCHSIATLQDGRHCCNKQEAAHENQPKLSQTPANNTPATTLTDLSPNNSI